MNEDRTEKFEWYEGETLQCLSKCMNFKIELLVGNGEYGHKVNGSWNGLTRPFGKSVPFYIVNNS